MRDLQFLLIGIWLALGTTTQGWAQGAVSTPVPPRVQAGQRVAFLGDSITQFGADHPAGYVRLIEAAFKDQGRAIVVIPAGVSGNTSKDMLARFKQDVLDKKPAWMLFSCGVNDVWHGANGVPLDQYKANITSMVDQATAAKIKVVLLTSTMITEDQAAPFNQQLIPYNNFLHDLAKQRNLPLADLNADMQAAVTQARKETGLTANLLTVDGVHMNGIGNEMMAAGILPELGLTSSEVAQARDLWLDLPGGMTLAPRADVSVRQYLQLRALASKQGLTPDQLLDQSFNQTLQNMLVDPASNSKPTH